MATRVRFPKPDMRGQLERIRDARFAREEEEELAAKAGREAERKRLEQALAELERQDRERYDRELRERKEAQSAWDRTPRDQRASRRPDPLLATNPAASFARRREHARRLFDAGSSVDAILAAIAGESKPAAEEPPPPQPVATIVSAGNGVVSADNAVEPADKLDGAVAAQDWRRIVEERIRSEDYSYNALGVECGVSASVVMRFAKGERDVTVATAQKICAALDLVLVPRETLRGD
jgi:hypothetical protein